LKGSVIVVLIVVASFIPFKLSSAAEVSMPPDGVELFASKCAKCHGPDGRGTAKYLKKGQKDFTDAAWQKSRTDAQLTKVVVEGKGDFMPAWKEKLSAEEIKALVGQIRAFGKKK
jgi:cytochrome c oxidase cbb3-type subunit 3